MGIGKEIVFDDRVAIGCVGEFQPENLGVVHRLLQTAPIPPRQVLFPDSLRQEAT